VLDTLAAARVEDWLNAGPVEARLDERRDRYGRAYGDLVREGVSLAAWLVENGHAAVAPGETAFDLPALLGAEAHARERRLGAWDRGTFGPFPAADITGEPVRFGLVEGLVVRSARTTIYWYANFGQRLREDFTVRVPVRAEKAFQAAGVELGALGGRRVRARGWLFEENGPMIEMTHPLALELLP
jgi:hypothetical protein